MSANRVTPAQVSALADAVPGIEMSQYIKTAHLMIELLLVAYETNADILREIELYLAGHYYQVVHPPASSESGTGLSESKRVGPLGRGLSSTPLGQQVLGLDRTGILSSALSNTQPIVFEVFGTGVA